MLIYNGLTKEELDREYSPSSCAPGYLRTLSRYASASAEARERLDHETDVPYGPDSVERLHFFPPRSSSAPMLVFVHGGHWQESSKEESCFPASALVEAGAGYIALGYGLAPHRTLDQMVSSVRRGLRWVRAHAHDLRTTPDAVYVCGSSAGAHLAAMAIALGSGESAVPVAGACLLSGVYDLEPVQHTYVNDALGLDKVTASRNSPINFLPLNTSSVIVARGAAETKEYARQHRFLAARIGKGPHSVADLVVKGRDHFDLPFDLGRRETVLGWALLEQMGLQAP